MRYQLNRNKFLSDSEQEYLKSRLAKDLSRNSLLIQTALATGARESEILAITLSDLDDKTQSVFIKGLKNSFDREIPLKPELYQALKVLGQNNGGRLFPISDRQVRNIWDQYKPCNKSFHCLRHTFAINLFKATKDLKLVQTALGHVQIMNTLIYADYVYKTSELKKISEYV
jgi:integrase